MKRFSQLTTISAVKIEVTATEIRKALGVPQHAILRFIGGSSRECYIIGTDGELECAWEERVQGAQKVENL